MIGLLYAIVIVAANTLGAISGMGGGVLIKPIFDFIGYDTVNAISFYSTVAVFTMSMVTTFRQIQSGVKLNLKMVAWIALGAMGGGVLGKQVLSFGLANYSEHQVLAVQIVLTIITILFALMNTWFNWRSFGLTGKGWFLGCGIALGFFASFLGIGGGPINVALLMLMFGLPIKEATVYSIATILFSQGSKLITIMLAGELATFDLKMLAAIIPAAIVGGLLGAHCSKILSAKHVTVVFQGMLFVVILINLWNGLQLF